MKLAFILLLLASNCCAYTIKATGYVRAVIVAPESIATVQETPATVVYTPVGATAQVVF